MHPRKRQIFFYLYSEFVLTFLCTISFFKPEIPDWSPGSSHLMSYHNKTHESMHSIHSFHFWIFSYSNTSQSFQSENDVSRQGSIFPSFTYVRTEEFPYTYLTKTRMQYSKSNYFHFSFSILSTLFFPLWPNHGKSFITRACFRNISTLPGFL